MSSCYYFVYKIDHEYNSQALGGNQSSVFFSFLHISLGMNSFELTIFIDVEIQFGVVNIKVEVDVA